MSLSITWRLMTALSTSIIIKIKRVNCSTLYWILCQHPNHHHHSTPYYLNPVGKRDKTMLGRAPIPRENNHQASCSMNTSSLILRNDSGMDRLHDKVKHKGQKLGGRMWVFTLIVFQLFRMFGKSHNKTVKGLDKGKECVKKEKLTWEIGHSTLQKSVINQYQRG